MSPPSPVTGNPARLTLDAETAADMMTANPISIREDATIKEIVALLVDKGFGAAPVIDQAGRPIGVVSRSDVLAHEREAQTHAVATQPYTARARDIMTPIVFSVAPDIAAAKVIEEMAALKVHRLFVVTGAGNLVGVVTALDILSRLH